MKPNSTISKRQKEDSKNLTSVPQKPTWLLWAILIIAMVGTFHEYVIQRDDGSYELSPERQEKLNRELEELEEAEQYALRARANKYYPCYNCDSSGMIYLNIGEVLKYGYTTKENRYTQKVLDDSELEYHRRVFS